ncbi:thioredoxin [Geitlerinema sp. PCC 9228]|uniref:thioredoxin n=1 Tax=Geitlerinema sp. PCC 9228 TaxID=111611 RepID=UPI0008F9AC65|nr:thioredoxin [Geitlerinema sp. PCC 9228]
MGYSIAVADHNFEEEVLAKSKEMPVIVDFYADWCGPCKMLSPLLEEIASEYDCVVAKVDVDQNQQVAQAYQVQGIPDVKIFRDGEVIEGFVGVLQRPQLRELLAKCNIKSAIDEAIAAVKQQEEAGKVEQAKTEFLHLLEKYPQNAQVTLEAAKLFVRTNELNQAKEIIDSASSDDRNLLDAFSSIKALIHFQEECQNDSGDSEVAQLYAQACCLAVAEKYQEALDKFLQVVSKDRKFKDDGGRKAAIAIFNLLGNEHPLTAEYRRHLTSVLY